jgi:Ala-tRNA(Pro) deacylase
MMLKKLSEFLDANRVKYVLIRHSPAYTAQETAASVHIPGKMLAKTVMVSVDGVLSMTVLPAPHHVDVFLFQEAMGARDVHLARESEFEGLFPGCELGAMPPFGNLFKLPVYVSACLAEGEEIAFPAGSHHEVVRMAYADFERLVHPRVVDFTWKAA